MACIPTTNQIVRLFRHVHQADMLLLRDSINFGILPSHFVFLCVPFAQGVCTTRPGSSEGWNSSSGVNYLALKHKDASAERESS